MKNPIRLYVGENYREPSLYTHSDIMFPFWGVAAKESTPFARAATAYQYSLKDFALETDIRTADYVFIPYTYGRLLHANPSRLQMIINEAKDAGKPLLIDAAGDIENALDIPYSYILRIGIYRYAIKPNEITIPSPSEDLLESYAGGTLLLREKGPVPIVGFAGWVHVSFRTRLKAYLKELPIMIPLLTHGKRGAEHKGVFFRERALTALKKEKRVNLALIARNNYSGHVTTMDKSAVEIRSEFVDLLLSSDYALCVKGDANSSVRFYEALSLGRIPLFVDTECVLPLEDQISYKDFCVFVDWKDIGRIGQIVADFHERCSADTFKNMQILAREAYEKFLRLDAFSRHLAAQLQEKPVK